MSQRAAAINVIRQAQRPLLFVYIHGWMNDANSGDVCRFEHFIDMVSRLPEVNRGKINVIGVYIAWRGKDLTVPGLDLLTFWNRKLTGGSVAAQNSCLATINELALTARAPGKQVHHCVLMGHSFGGTFTLYALFTEPGLFSGYVAGSPSVVFGDDFAFKQEAEYASSHKDLPVRLYLFVGGSEDLRYPVEEFIQVLRDCGALHALLPELDALFGVPQPAAHHPEIDTGEHVLAVLRQCAAHEQPLPVRWACLLHDLGKGLTPPDEWPRHIAHEQKGLKPIRTVNARCKAPRDCQELALLVGEYHTHGHRAQELRPTTLLELLQRFDVYRRPQRFEEFVAACEMDARGRLGLEKRDYPQAAYLHGAAAAARAVQSGPLLAKGLQGAALGEALKHERLCALKAYKAGHPAG